LTQEPNTGMKRSGVLTFKMDPKQGYSQDSNETIKTRWEFVGNIAETKIRKKYKGKSVSHYGMFIKGARNPIKYWKC